MKRSDALTTAGVILVVAISVVKCTEEKKICGCGCRRVLSSAEANDDSIIAGTCRCKECSMKHQQEEDDTSVENIKSKRLVDVQQSLEFTKIPLKKDIQHPRKLLDDIDKNDDSRRFNENIRGYRRKVINKDVLRVDPKYPASVIYKEDETDYDSIDISALDWAKIYKLSNNLEISDKNQPINIAETLELGTKTADGMAIKVGFSNTMWKHIEEKDLSRSDIDDMLDKNWNSLRVFNVKRGRHFDISLPLNRDAVTRILRRDRSRGYRRNRNDDERHYREHPKIYCNQQPVRILAGIPIALGTIYKQRHLL